MNFLPLFLKTNSQQILVVGSTSSAIRKVELLLKTEATLILPVKIKEQDGIADQLMTLSSERVTYYTEYEPILLDNAHIIIVATDDDDVDSQVSILAKERHIPVNVVNKPDLSTFIFPSIIDRSPVLIAVSSGGEMPLLSRLLRNRLEANIPEGYGRLARLAGKWRNAVAEKYVTINQRRKFWEMHLEARFADLVFTGNTDQAEQLLSRSLNKPLDEKNPPSGEVYLVGAGPGDPDLLTFKALRLMRQADIVLYDRLVSKPVLDMVRADAEKIDVGKQRCNHTLPQQKINDMLVTLAKQGKRVLRLKGGDPFIFGRGGEELDQLAEAGIPFQVVPGITAASGCASYAGIPLTHRDYSQSVKFITGHLKNNTCELPWDEFVHLNQTLVFYMGLTGLPLISEQLIQHGMSVDMPVALISKGTTPEQKVVTGTLMTISGLVASADISAPTLIIIGEVVKLREKLNWLE